MTDFRKTVKMMIMAMVMAVTFCSCNAAGGSDSYEASSPEYVAIRKPTFAKNQGKSI